MQIVGADGKTYTVVDPSKQSTVQIVKNAVKNTGPQASTYGGIAQTAGLGALTLVSTGLTPQGADLAGQAADAAIAGVGGNYPAAILGGVSVLFSLLQIYRNEASSNAAIEKNVNSKSVDELRDELDGLRNQLQQEIGRAHV